MSRKPVLRKIAESVVVVAAGAGLMAFGTFGTLEDARTPHSQVLTGRS